LNDPDDRMVMTFDLGDNNVNVDNFYTGDNYPNTGYATGVATGETGDGVSHFGDAVPEGSSVNIKITTKSGATTTEQLTVPETVSGASAVQL
jgi:archaellin